mmetsp:Transcript_12405/g.15386  ORF Transcript_12405/g.15386 Transcript_12405/m.15386 type:complete len:298 (+) Transcript_12405:156-1049(+)
MFFYYNIRYAFLRDAAAQFQKSQRNALALNSTKKQSETPYNSSISSSSQDMISETDMRSEKHEKIVDDITTTAATVEGKRDPCGQDHSTGQSYHIKATVPSKLRGNEQIENMIPIPTDSVFNPDADKPRGGAIYKQNSNRKVTDDFSVPSPIPILLGSTFDPNADKPKGGSRYDNLRQNQENHAVTIKNSIKSSKDTFIILPDNNLFNPDADKPGPGTMYIRMRSKQNISVSRDKLEKIDVQNATFQSCCPQTCLGRIAISTASDKVHNDTKKSKESQEKNYPKKKDIPRLSKPRSS